MPAPSNRPHTISLLRLYLGNHAYCIESAMAPSIRRAEELKQIFGITGPSIGAFPDEDPPIPVYSLSERLGLGEPLASNGPIAILDCGQARFGVQADRVARPVEVPMESMSKLPEYLSGEQGVVRGATHIEGVLTLFLSAAAMGPSSALDGAARGDSEFQPPRKWAGGLPSAETRLLCCTEPGGDESTIFGFSLRQLLEVVEDLTVIPCNGRSECITGVTEWRGFLAPVIDLRSMLGIREDRPSPQGSKLAILRGIRSNDLFAVPCHSLTTLSAPYQDKLGATTPLPSPGKYIRSAYRAGNRILVSPDLDRLAV